MMNEHTPALNDLRTYQRPTDFGAALDRMTEMLADMGDSARPHILTFLKLMKAYGIKVSVPVSYIIKPLEILELQTLVLDYVSARYPEQPAVMTDEYAVTVELISVYIDCVTPTPTHETHSTVN